MLAERQLWCLEYIEVIIIYLHNYANSQLAWGTNQTVDLFKSFNPAWSSKLFYIKLITYNMTDIVVAPCVHLSFPIDVTSHSLRIWVMGLPWRFKWLCSANFCAFHRTLKFSMIGLDQVWGMMTHIRKREEITSWFGNRWHDAMYHEADH